jgi:hypothetical protein
MGASSTGRRGGDGGSKGPRSSVRADPFPPRDSRLRKWGEVDRIDLLPVSLRPSRLWRCYLLLAGSCRPLLARSAARRCCASGSSTPPSDDGRRRRPYKSRSRDDPGPPDARRRCIRAAACTLSPPLDGRRLHACVGDDLALVDPAAPLQLPAAGPPTARHPHHACVPAAVAVLPVMLVRGCLFTCDRRTVQ